MDSRIKIYFPIKARNESIEDYQITIADDIDFLKIIDILKKNNFEEKYSINKKYVHSLFTPLLSFIIEYLNNNKEKKNEYPFIGISKMFDIPVIYSLLNKEVYDLFFKRQKGKIFEGNDEINYEFEPDKENYYITYMNKRYKTNEKTLKNTLSKMIGEDAEILLKEDTLETIFELKRKEIISMFRQGYSIQERIINLFHAKAGNELIELPNIIFYKKNQENKLYNEIDRIITSKNDIDVDEFVVYLIAEFSTKNSNEVNVIEIPEGKILHLEKDSCNYIEVKTSVNWFLERDKQDTETHEKAENQIKEEDKGKKGKEGSGKVEKENDNKSSIIKIKTPSDLTSKLSDENIYKTTKNKLYDNMTIFKTLLENINMKFKSHNLIIIIDSYFTKDFLKITKEFIEKWKEEDIYFDFNVYFVHIEINIEYTYQINEFERMKIDSKNKDLKLKKLTEDALIKSKKITQLEESTKKWNVIIMKK